MKDAAVTITLTEDEFVSLKGYLIMLSSRLHNEAGYQERPYDGLATQTTRQLEYIVSQEKGLAETLESAERDRALGNEVFRLGEAIAKQGPQPTREITTDRQRPVMRAS